MFRYSNAAVAVLALALGCSPLLAQSDGDPQDPPQGQHGPRGGFGQRGPDGPGGPGRDAGQWGRRGDFGPGRNFGERGGNFGRHGGFDRDGNRQGGRSFGMRREGGGLERLLNDPDIRKQAGITDEQAAKIRQQASDFRKSQIRDRADLQVKRLDLQELLAADKPDHTAIDSKLSEISAAQLALQKSSVDFRLNMRDAITPAQRDKIRQLMMNRGRNGGGPEKPGPQGQGRRGPQGNGGPGGPGGPGGRGPRGGASAPGSQTTPPPPNGN